MNSVTYRSMRSSSWRFWSAACFLARRKDSSCPNFTRSDVLPPPSMLLMPPPPLLLLLANEDGLLWPADTAPKLPYLALSSSKVLRRTSSTGAPSAEELLAPPLLLLLLVLLRPADESEEAGDVAGDSRLAHAASTTDTLVPSLLGFLRNNLYIIFE